MESAINQIKIALTVGTVVLLSACSLHQQQEIKPKNPRQDTNESKDEVCVNFSSGKASYSNSTLQFTLEGCEEDGVYLWEIIPPQLDTETKTKQENNYI